MYKMSREQIDNRMVIESKGLNRTSQQRFVSDLFKAFEAGYVVAPSGWQADKPVIKANKRKVVLYKKGYEVIEPKGSDVDKRDYLAEAKAAEGIVEPEVVESIEEDISEEVQPEPEAVVEEEKEVSLKATLKATLEGLNSKEDLIAFASEHKLEYSEEEAKYPKKLKKVLASKL